MSRVFAYARVSTTGQTTENQILEIAAAGFAVERRRVSSETVSGGEAIARRRGFSLCLIGWSKATFSSLPASIGSDATRST